jgi:2-dehydropantoate 2-reductase
MTDRRHYIVLGAGAVGGTLGALLARAGHPVTLVARAATVRAIETQGGLVHVVAGERHLVPLAAVTAPEEVTLAGRPVLFFAMKAGDLGPALEPAARAFGPAALAVTWQNGLRAEDGAASRFHNLLGGVVRATSTMLVPGEVRIRTPGILILGRWPVPPSPQPDPDLDATVADLRGAGFDAVASPDIAADKGLKLLVNLFSGVTPLVRPDGRPAMAVLRFERNVIVEGARVLSAAGRPFHAAGGRGDDVTAMLRHLSEKAPRAPVADGVHNSTWQNLATPGRRLENDYMNGEIVRLARERGVSAPWNQRLLDILADVQARGLGPDSLRDADLAARIADLPDPPPWHPDEDDRPGR